MSIAMHTLKPAKGSRKKSRRLGRGRGSSKGTTAGKGTKGQGARTGGRNRRALRGLRRLVLSTPKLRGFRSLKAKPEVLSVAEIAAAFENGAKVTPRTLKQKGLVTDAKASVKLLGGGEIKVKLLVAGCAVTEGAKAAIEKAGGSVN